MKTDENIVKRWKIMASKDLGIERNMEARDFAEMFIKVFECGQNQPSGSPYINPIIRGFAINEHMEDECNVVDALDLNYINITTYAARELDYYLMDNLGWYDRWQFANQCQ